MSGYTWNIPAGGAITSGFGTNTITVTWNTAGAQTVSVNYTNANGCSAAYPTVYTITVNALPVPAILGPTPVCLGSTGNVYTTQAGMTNYIWAISAGGTITAGGSGTSNSVTVQWNTAGAQTVSVNYTNANGCSAALPTVYPVTVNALPVPAITGSAAASLDVQTVYSTERGMTNYQWIVSSGGKISTGGKPTDYTVTVVWGIAGSQSVSVNYSNSYGCSATSPTVLKVAVKQGLLKNKPAK